MAPPVDCPQVAVSEDMLRIIGSNRAWLKAPHVEQLLFFYAFGKPVERHEVTTAIGDFSKLSDEELMAQFEATVMSLRAERRVEGEKELLSASAPTTV